MSRSLNKIILIFALVGLISFGWYRWSGNNNHSGLIDLASGKRLMVVNVLDPEQYQDCHIKGSINVPFDRLESFAQKLDQETELVFYCSNYMCAASGKAAQLLEQKGFKRVWAYEAGMADWYQKQLPVEGGCKSAYLNMKNYPLQAEEQASFVTISTNDLKAKLGY